MNEDFYTAFEARFRGSRELIAGRLAAYLPFLEALARLYPGGAVVDLGCGRGEWLELVREKGFQGLGVDLDDMMLEDCRSRQLQVVTGDALDHLQSLPDASQCLVSAFHLVEHIPFDRLQALVREAHRVLQPGGLLIVETPNSENLTVATSSFYLDPTHTQPLPLQLLGFLADYSGFHRTELLRLNGEPLPDAAHIGLGHVLTHVSPDCSIVAQKLASADAMAPFDPVFALDWGVSLPQVTQAYELAMRARFERHEVQQAQTQARLGLYKEQIQRAAQELAMYREECSEMRNEVNAVHQTLLAMQNSRSWRWTAPVRGLRASTRSVGGKVLRRAMPIARGIAHRTPWTRKFVRVVLMSSPPLARFVGRFLKRPDPTAPPVAPPPPPITLFKDLRSVKLMAAIARSEQEGATIVYVGKDDHAG